MKPKYIYDLFEYNRDYASQEEILFKISKRFPFLALIHKLQMPAVIRFLKGNYTALYRDSEEILSQCKEVLDKDLLDQIKSVLHNNNPSKFKGLLLQSKGLRIGHIVIILLLQRI